MEEARCEQFLTWTLTEHGRMSPYLQERVAWLAAQLSRMPKLVRRALLLSQCWQEVTSPAA